MKAPGPIRRKRMKDRILYLNLYIGLAGLLAAFTLLALGLPFMKVWFYCFAWWSFIVLVDSLNVRSFGSSPLRESGPGFFEAAFISVPVWLGFELFNLRLENWSYHGLPERLWERWPGYFIAFATVVPALQELASFFRGCLKSRKIVVRRLIVTRSLLRASSIAGFISLALSMAWPRFFFPFAWLGLIFLLEPVNYRRQTPSFLGDLEKGRAERLASWALAGIAAGLVWEFFNDWAGSHWEYSIPYFNFWKVFQMPLFGYGGFIPFALEIFAIYGLLDSVHQKIRRKPFARLLFWSGLLAFDFVCFYLVDIWTVL